jgi:protein-S-isoprenylcysteine O-methyltransferase Ste14
MPQAPVSQARSPAIGIKLGKLTLTGGPAIAVLLGVLALIVALIVYARPSLSNWPVWVSGALWIAFIVYWSAAGKNAGPTKSSETPASRRVHERLMNIALLLLFVPVPGLGVWALPVSSLSVPIGLGVQAGAFAFAVWARKHLGRNWSGAITVAIDHQLIRSGPYRWVRHPIYTAMLGMFAGTAIVSSTWHALLGVAVICAAYARKIPLEERTLRDAFGPAYDAYRQETRALIPWIL